MVTLVGAGRPGTRSRLIDLPSAMMFLLFIYSSLVLLCVLAVSHAIAEQGGCGAVEGNEKNPRAKTQTFFLSFTQLDPGKMGLALFVIIYDMLDSFYPDRLSLALLIALDCVHVCEGEKYDFFILLFELVDC